MATPIEAKALREYCEIVLGNDTMVTIMDYTGKGMQSLEPSKTEDDMDEA